MASSRELEHRAETDRNRIAETLNRLRERMSPGQLVDQAVEYARSNGGVDFARNLSNQAKANPIPVVIMAVGLGWLIFGRPPARRAYAPSIVPDDEYEAERSSLDERFDELARDRTAEVASAETPPPSARGAPGIAPGKLGTTPARVLKTPPAARAMPRGEPGRTPGTPRPPPMTPQPAARPRRHAARCRRPIARRPARSPGQRMPSMAGLPQ